MIPALDQHTAIAWVARLAAIATLVSCAEYLAEPRHLRDDGLMSWRVGRLRKAWFVARPAGSVLDALLGYPNVLWLLTARIVVASAMVLATAAIATHALLVASAMILSWLFYIRNIYGQDGADQLTWIVFTALMVTSVGETPLANTAVLWFIALQGCLAYGAAGIAKATASGWRDGTYLVGICGTEIYGHRALTAYLKPRPDLARWLARLIILWECTFPFILVVPTSIAVVMLVTGFLFHLVNAHVMGLNTFVWSFLATYPAILYCVQSRPW